MGKEFFNEVAPQSEVKSAIVSKYFGVWAKAIKNTAKQRHNKLAYMDLFAGPGRYEDGTVSTPLLILQQAIADPDLRQMLVTIFNDVDGESSSKLVKEIEALPGIGTLKYAPKVYNAEVGTKIVQMFESMTFVPTLFFVDPWGYKGLSLKLINSVLKDWGCECIFFFNYNRINAGLPNDIVEEHLDALFGKPRADKLRETLSGLKPHQREYAIVEAIGEALQELGGKYVLPFRFCRPHRQQTSHHLIFVTKDKLGYKLMKEVMAGESSTTEQGVPTFEYNPSYRPEGLLFELSRPLDDLSDMLLQQYTGQTSTFTEIFEDHNYGHRFIERNYKDILSKMEQQGLVSCNPPASARRSYKGAPSFGPNTKVVFPKKDGANV